MVKDSPANAGEPGSIPGWGRYTGVGNGTPLLYSCLEISWTEDPGGPQPIGHRVRHNLPTKLQYYFPRSMTGPSVNPCVHNSQLL